MSRRRWGRYKKPRKGFGVGGWVWGPTPFHGHGQKAPHLDAVGPYQRRAGPRLREVKHIDHVVSETMGTMQAGTTPTPQLISGSSQGTDFDERVGRMIYLESLTGRFEFQQGSTNESQWITMYIVLIPHNNGGTPVYTDLVADGEDVNALREHNHVSQLKVLKKIIFKLPSSGDGVVTGQYKGRRRINFYIKLRGLRVTYNANTADFAGSQNNAVCLFLKTSSSGGTSVAAQQQGRIRMHFTDA